MKVPLIDLKGQYQQIKAEIGAGINEVLESQEFILGQKVADFEDALATYLRARHCIGVASGSDALLIALMALGIAGTDEVITTPYTFFATAGCISRLGARPSFVDIDPGTYNLDPVKLEEFLAKLAPNGEGGQGLVNPQTGRRVKALIVVHLFGQCADMDPIAELCGKYGLALVEDAAQALGASYRGRKAGVMGEVGCFSFFPSKNLGGFGDGGAVVTNDPSLAEEMRTLRVHGGRHKYYHERVGLNSRLDTLQAAVLEVKLRYLDRWIEIRRNRADFYRQLFHESGLTRECGGPVDLPKTNPSGIHTYCLYVVRAKDRDRLRKFLADRGVSTAVYYPLSLHLQKCFMDLGYKEGDFPESERASKESISIPIYPEIDAGQQEYVVKKIEQFYHSQAT